MRGIAVKTRRSNRRSAAARVRLARDELGLGRGVEQLLEDVCDALHHRSHLHLAAHFELARRHLDRRRAVGAREAHVKHALRLVRRHGSQQRAVLDPCYRSSLQVLLDRCLASPARFTVIGRRPARRR